MACIQHCLVNTAAGCNMSRWCCLKRHALVVKPNDTEKAYREALGIDLEKGTRSFDKRIRKEYRLHTAQYWFVASLTNGLLWMQIVLGAALTALGALRTSESQTATIYLGAASTITAGLLTYFKSRNQPNRARQLRQALRSVRNKIDDQSRALAGLTPEAARGMAQEIIKQYDNALAEAATNYPDLWVTLEDMRKFLDGNDKGDNQPGIDKSGARTKPDEHGRSAPSSPTKPPKQHESHTGSSETQAEPDDNSPQRNSTTFHTQALAPAPPSNLETPTNPEVKPIEETIDIDKDFSHPDKGPPEKSDRDTTTAAAAAAAADKPQAPTPTAQSSHVHTAGPV